jgi:hypothetical protein
MMLVNAWTRSVLVPLPAARCPRPFPDTRNHLRRYHITRSNAVAESARRMSRSCASMNAGPDRSRAPPVSLLLSCACSDHVVCPTALSSACSERKRRLAKKEIGLFFSDPGASPALLVFSLFLLGGPFAGVTRATITVLRQLMKKPP